MSYMKNHMMDIGYEMIDKTSKETGISAWAIEEAASYIGEDWLQDIETICEVAKHGEESIINFYDDMTNSFTDVKNLLCKTELEDIEYESKDELMSDILYNVSEICKALQ